jgi:hypothetical protein
MRFIQLIECHTERCEELMAIEEQWLAATEGSRTLRRIVVTRDRTDRHRYLVLALFEQEAVLDGRMIFTDLDIVADRDLTEA